MLGKNKSNTHTNMTPEHLVLHVTLICNKCIQGTFRLEWDRTSQTTFWDGQGRNVIVSQPGVTEISTVTTFLKNRSAELIERLCNT